jgi:hypothetical protein
MVYSGHGFSTLKIMGTLELKSSFMDGHGLKLVAHHTEFIDKFQPILYYIDLIDYLFKKLT